MISSNPVKKRRKHLEMDFAEAHAVVVIVVIKRNLELLQPKPPKMPVAARMDHDEQIVKR